MEINIRKWKYTIIFFVFACIIQIIFKSTHLDLWVIYLITQPFVLILGHFKIFYPVLMGGELSSIFYIIYLAIIGYLIDFINCKNGKKTTIIFTLIFFIVGTIINFFALALGG